MPIDMQWYDSTQRIVWIRFTSPWTWKEFATLHDHGIDMAASVQHRICFLVDMASVRHLPVGLPLSTIYPVLSADHPNTDSYIIVGAHPSVRKTLMILLRVMRLNTRITLVNTLDEGLTIIRERLSALNGNA